MFGGDGDEISMMERNERNQGDKEEAECNGDGAAIVDIEDVMMSDGGRREDAEFIIPQFDGGDGTAPRSNRLFHCTIYGLTLPLIQSVDAHECSLSVFHSILLSLN